MPALPLVWLLLAPLLAGAAGLRGLGVRWRDDRIAFLGWAWVVGTLALTLVLFGWSWFGLPHPRAAATMLLAALALGAELRARRRPVASAPAAASAATSEAPRWERALFASALLLALFVVFDRILIGNAVIVCSGDEAVIWAAKAKAFHFAGGMGDEFRRLLLGQQVGHRDYPPLNPLLQWWTWLHAGAAVDVENRLPIQLFVPATLLVAAGALSRVARPAFAAALLLLVAFNQAMAHATLTASADGIVTCGFLVAADAWLRFRGSGERKWFALAMVGLATSIFAKNEGALLAVAFGSAVGIAAFRSRTLRRQLAALGAAGAWLLVPIACELAQRAFNLRFGLTNDLFGGDGAAPLWSQLAHRLDAESIATVARWFARSWFFTPTFGERIPAPHSAWLLPSDQNLLFPAFLLASLVEPRRAFCGALGVVTGALLLAIAGFAVVYLGTAHDLEWHLKTSVGRVLFDVVPAAAVTLAALHSRDGLDGGTERGGIPAGTRAGV